jgi:signal peptidase I
MRILIRELFETVILALLIFLTLHISVQNYRVQGPSMQPTLVEGDYVIVNKMVYLRFDPTEIANILPFYDRENEGSLFPFHQPERGEVIIFRFPKDPSRDFVKRVIGVPGDIVEINDGEVIRNGELLDEPYITQGDNSNMSPIQVEPDEYFVLGDNRRASNDSRDWGPVPTDNVIGRAWVSFWPLDQWHSLQAWLSFTQ